MPREGRFQAAGLAVDCNHCGGAEFRLRKATHQGLIAWTKDGRVDVLTCLHCGAQQTFALHALVDANA